jgi:beta-lactamase class D
MSRRISLFTAIIALVIFHSCTVNNVTEDDAIGEIFTQHGVKGTFGMFDNSRGEFTLYDLERFRSNQSPGQTFHLFETLVALHTGKLADDSSLIVSDDSASTSLTLNEAFRQNSIPHFRGLAKQIGNDTLKRWIDSLKYGNKRLGPQPEQSWMNDTLKISADEQLGFMKRFYFRQHPFRESVQESVKKMMIVVNNSNYQLAYLQATVPKGATQLGWVIGWIEENRHVYPFVMNFDAPNGMDTDAEGKKLTQEILTHIGFFKGIM